MNDNSNNSIERLLESANKLLKRFEEQKGVLGAYIQKEREWKKYKLLQMNKIKGLEKEIKKLSKAFKGQ